MSKENGIIDSLGLDKIQDEIKSLYQELEKANAGIVGFGEKVSAAVKGAVAALKELKAASNFTELREAAKKTAGEN
jgi:hypothetical protein